MTERFSDKVVLVTGGSGVLAGATAQAFAAEGGTVILASPEEKRLAQAAARIEDTGGRADWVAADVTVPEDVERLVDTVVDRHGGLHVAFNCAGVFGVTAPVADLDPDTCPRC